MEYSSIIILIEINFKYPRIKASFHGQRLGVFSQAHDDSSGEGVKITDTSYSSTNTPGLNTPRRIALRPNYILCTSIQCTQRSNKAASHTKKLT